MKENFDSLFDPAIIRDTIAFYETRDRWQEILNYRKLTAETGHVDNLFYGDSITDIWPLHFPDVLPVVRDYAGKKDAPYS